MRVIDLDASQWATVMDFVTALRAAVGAPDWHGASPAAFVDSMIWGDINGVKPPYTIRVAGTEHGPAEVKDYVELMAHVLRKARADQRARRSIETEVSLELAP